MMLEFGIMILVVGFLVELVDQSLPKPWNLLGIAGFIVLFMLCGFIPRMYYRHKDKEWQREWLKKHPLEETDNED